MEISHHGIKGMKWGIRRSESQLARAHGNQADKAVKEQRKQVSAARRHLSDGDLKKAVERLQQEKKLKDLTNEDVSRGKTIAANILGQIGKSTITAVGTAVATYAVKAAMEQHFDIKDAAKFIKPKK